MAYRERRPRLSAAERAELWTRWKQGDRLSDIAAFAMGWCSNGGWVRCAPGFPSGRPWSLQAPRSGCAAAATCCESGHLSRWACMPGGVSTRRTARLACAGLWRARCRPTD